RAATCIVLCFANSLLAASRTEEWQKVEAEIRSGRPRSAITVLDTIAATAFAEQEHAEALKALGRKIALEGTIQGNKPETKIVLLQAEIEKAPADIKAVMEVLLAHWYWHYFQQNRWRFQQRTATAVAPGPDLQTWDLPRILAEIDRHFTAALVDEARLKATPIHTLDALLERGNIPDAYRPTLFDFIAYEALLFYQAGEQAGRKAEDAFELDASATPIFADATEFLAWQPAGGDGTEPTPKAVRLFQRLLQFHRDGADPSAFYDADLARLRFGYNQATGDDKVPRYTAALERFAAATAQHEVSARALAALGTVLNDAGEPAKAHAIAQRGLDAFPDTAGGAQCFNLIQTIESKIASLATERLWNAPWPTLDVTYRNVSKVYFRAVAVDFPRHVARARWSLERLDITERQILLATPPALAWSATLPPTLDYKMRTERLSAPTTLRPGFYYIFASHDEAFGDEDIPVSVGSVWVSSLALLTHRDSSDGDHGGLVLDARSGEPIRGATVRFWRVDREGWFKSDGSVATDGNGRFELPSADGRVLLLAEHRGHAIASGGPVHVGRRNEREPPGSHTAFFTDRSLYRPGQTIHYKGIALKFDQKAGKYSTTSRREIVVVFNDGNNKEVARATHRTNDYGSFSGTFTAPRDRLAGRMRLSTDDGATSFNVEEYKRPKFQVEIGLPREAAKLDAPVELTGKATAYTGAAIGGASVKWRVERTVACPAWCWWWQPPAVQAIAHGAAVTDADGTFPIRFTATPDRSVPASNEPVFTFTIHADVTDTTGETRSHTRTVRAGYAALQASVSAEEWQTAAQPVAFAIETRTLDGEATAASGTLTIHALQSPATVERAPLPSAGYVPWATRGDALRAD
ncbi:MAG: MG2 domain-containing protein, partial [Opitutaceae bacterium]